MRTQCSFIDLALMAPLLQASLAKRLLARRALALVEGPAFDERVALATVDRLVSFGLVRNVRARHDRMGQLISPRLVPGDGRSAA